MVENNLYALNWSNHTNHIRLAFESLFSKNELVDVTLSCEGKKVGAHKVLLSACSTYFHDLFRDNPCQHPIVILKDVKFQNLMYILQFVYNGEVSVTTDNLDHFLKTAELLQISGLTDSEKEGGNEIVENSPSSKPNNITENRSKEYRRKRRQSSEDFSNNKLERNSCYKKKRENESQIDMKIKQEYMLDLQDESGEIRTFENFDDDALEDDILFQREQRNDELQTDIQIKQEFITLLDDEEEEEQNRDGEYRNGLLEINKQNETILTTRTFRPDTLGSDKTLSSKRSAIWLNFSIPSKNKAQCNLCHAVYSVKSGSTSNLIRHIKFKHPTIRIQESQHRRFSLE